MRRRCRTDPVRLANSRACRRWFGLVVLGSRQVGLCEVGSAGRPVPGRRSGPPPPGRVQAVHRVVVAEQGKDVAAPSGQVTVVEEDAQHVRVAVLVARRELAAAASSARRQSSGSPAWAHSSASAAYSQARRRGDPAWPTVVAHHVPVRRASAAGRLAQHVRLLRHGVREVHGLSASWPPASQARSAAKPVRPLPTSIACHAASVDAPASASATGRRVLGSTAKFSASSRAAR